MYTLSLPLIYVTTTQWQVVHLPFVINNGFKIIFKIVSFIITYEC